IGVIAGNLDAAAVFFHDWRHLSDPYITEFKVLRFRYEGLFHDILKQGMETKTFRIGDEKFTALTIFSALNWTYEWYKPDGKMSAVEIGEQLADILINGLKSN
ncbi:MAG: TetR/AcrR family transcriptional regulator, partial [Bacteroidota bacterium]|nr:TetR/AcrR family transcriptional regulator [Bacteroidota bacterium]